MPSTVSGDTERRDHSSAMWIDPDAAVPRGVLLADRIAYYAELVNLVAPFEVKRLGPASYDLTLGADCWYAHHVEATGESRKTLSQGEKLIIEPNSIVYVTSAETLNLPFYLVGRFNLKLRFLHEGLLVGTGPQVDPGFAGRLSCPLHNVSSSKVSIAQGDTFAVVEFQKTTPFGESETWTGKETIQDVRSRGEAMLVKGLDGRPCLTFPMKSLYREPVKRYVPSGRLVTSSVQGLAARIDLFEGNTKATVDEFKRHLSVVNVGTLIAVAVIAISVASYFVGVFNVYKGAYDAASQALERVKILEAERSAAQGRIEELDDRVQALQRASGAATTVSPQARPTSTR
jgi:deoxycytidine triphosphate deaminase